MWFSSTSILPACWPLFSQEHVFSALWNLWKHIPKSWTLDQPPLPYTTRLSFPGVGEVDFPPPKSWFRVFLLKLFHDFSHRLGLVSWGGVEYWDSVTRIAWWESFRETREFDTIKPNNSDQPLSAHLQQGAYPSSHHASAGLVSFVREMSSCWLGTWWGYPWWPSHPSMVAALQEVSCKLVHVVLIAGSVPSAFKMKYFQGFGL